ncbi:hypothetical protein [Paracoccus sediminilitoris]|uniref:hypothetical protein n=1 Tax=Paracoccus sediminilitoris TaxID=2202419 RepID=UPI000DB97685|nr:hypothetical protein [Paracoccus sediminilitoris]
MRAQTSDLLVDATAARWQLVGDHEFIQWLGNDARATELTLMSNNYLTAKAGDTGMLFIKGRISWPAQGPIITR